MITTRDKWLFDIARKAAQLSECRQKHGAVIARGSIVVSLACNRLVTHPISHKWSERATIHSEQRAIILAKDVEGLTLYSARFGGSEKSCPCPMCSFLIREAGIKEIIYNDGNHLIKERV